MNILLWIFQILLALHTAIGAVWKFSHSAQTIPSLKAIPHEAWLAMSALELLCSLGLILPAFNKQFAMLAPVAALCIGLEMLIFCVIHLYSGESNYSPMVYWLVVAAICGFVGYGRFVLSPVQ